MAQRQKHAFTLTELLVVIAIIALLISMAIPGINMVRKQAKEGIARAQIETIGQGVESFRQDLGRYPASSERWPAVRRVNDPSDDHWDASYADSGAHRLFEAMLGNDLLGYSDYMLPSKKDIPLNYYYVNNNGEPSDENDQPIKRYGKYLTMDKVNFGPLSEVAESIGFTSPDAEEKEIWQNTNPVLFDGMNVNKPRPILYYRAHRNESLIHNIYDERDNRDIISGPDLPGFDFDIYTTGDYDTLAEAKTLPGFLWDPETGYATSGDEGDKLNSPTARPYNADTFILWSAGYDGEFGTDDDITNFDRR